MRLPARCHPSLAALLQYARRDGPNARAPQAAARRVRGRLTRPLHVWRLVAWTAVIAVLAIASYAGRLSGQVEALPADAFFRYSTAIAAVIVDGILFIVVLLIARGLPLRETFALRPPRGWGRAALVGVATLLAAYALSFTEVGLLPNVAREQSVPQFFDAARLSAWVANLFVIAVFVPIFEESLCRGLGYALVEPLGKWTAVIVTGVAFTLAHGVIVDIPVILATGIGLGYLRAASGSLYPCLALHAFFNGFGLIAAAFVTGG